MHVLGIDKLNQRYLCDLQYVPTCPGWWEVGFGAAWPIQRCFWSRSFDYYWVDHLITYSLYTLTGESWRLTLKHPLLAWTKSSLTLRHSLQSFIPPRQLKLKIFRTFVYFLQRFFVSKRRQEQYAQSMHTNKTAGASLLSY